MRFLILVKASKDSEAGVMPSEQLLSDMGKFNEQLAQAGIMLAGEGLQPSSKGARVRFSGDKRIVIDGPFAETKELLAGYWLWQCKSREEAIEWVKRCPNPMPGQEAEIEIRQVFEAEDFGPELTPEIRQQEERVRAKSPPKIDANSRLLRRGLQQPFTNWETTMKYMLLIYMDENAMDSAEREACYAQSAQLCHDLQAKRQYLDASPLQPVATATSVRVRDGKPLITDGPFAETREQLGGYYVVDAKDLNEAINIAARIPPARKGTVEIRPIMELAGLPTR